MNNNNNTAIDLSKLPPDPMDLQEESLEQLKARAEALGVQLQTEDKSEIIEQIINAGAVPVQVDLSNVQTGQLFSIHTRTEEATNFVREAKKRITINENNPRIRPLKLFLKNRQGEPYNRLSSYVTLSKERMKEVMDYIVIPKEAEEQQKMLDEYKEHPESFYDPVLVRLRRQNSRSDDLGSYVMLYLRKKSEQPQAEVTF